MVTIRLARGGATKKPFYRIVVMDRRRAATAGRRIEQVGFFDPRAAGDKERLRVAQDRVQYWLERGAKPTERVAKLLKTAK